MRIVYLLAISLMSGCGILPPYHPPAEDVTVLKVTELPNPWICVEGKIFSLKADKNGEVLIPTNKRVEIGSRHSWSGYNVTYSCNPSISFAAESGITYFANWEMIDERCGIEIYRVSTENRVGLDFEPSIGRGWCAKY